MGTTYTVLQHDLHVDRGGNEPTSGFKIELDESSNVFDLSVTTTENLVVRPFNDGCVNVDVARGLTFAQLRELRDGIDKVLGYFQEQHNDTLTSPPATRRLR